jgi:hypothetical protein
VVDPDSPAFGEAEKLRSEFVIPVEARHLQELLVLARMDARDGTRKSRAKAALPV